MTLPPKILALLAFYTRWLERAAPKRVRELVEIGVEVHRDLERQLKKLKPGKFTTTQTAEVLVQTRTLLEAAAETYGEQMGDVLQAIHVDGAKRGREALEKQIDAWEAEGLLPPRPADSTLGPTDSPPAPGGGGEGGGSSRGRKVKPELVAELLDPGLIKLHEASRQAYGEELIAKMRRSLARGVLANETIAQTTERMAVDFEMPAWRAERIVRTEQSFAFHRRQLIDIEEQWGKEEANERWRKQLLAVHDDRTGDDSKFVDGQIRKINEKFWDKKRLYLHPPNRPNDREKMVLIPSEPLTEPTNGRLRGDPTPLKSGEGEDAIRRENEAAIALSQAGYDVFRNPGANRAGKRPDYTIDGKDFDCISPETRRARNVWSRVEEKIRDRQAQRFVINLEAFGGSKEELLEQFRDWQLDGLEEVLAVDRNGGVFRVFP